MKSFFLLITQLLLGCTLLAQPISTYWQDLPQEITYLTTSAEVLPQNARTLSLDISSIKNQIINAPNKFSANARMANYPLQLPLPAGGYKTFLMLKSSPMHPDLEAKYPNIQAWHGKCLEDGISVVALTISPQGLFATIINERFEKIFIEPVENAGFPAYISYAEKEIPLPPALECKHEAETVEERGQSGVRNEPILRNSANNNPGALGDKLRTHRFAMAANTGFSNANGNTIPSVMAKFAEFVNIQNLLYIRELSINFQLIADTDKLIFINGMNSTGVNDPYLDNGSSADLAINQTTTDNIVGNGSYDIGHVMNLQSGWGGSGPCNDASKAHGSSWGLRALNHEIGHQFSCPHTTDQPPHIYEATGIANTVMGRNDALGNDDYFHLSSALFVSSWVEKPNYCISGTDTDNTIPIVEVGTGGMTIPQGTPFQLSGSAIDPDPNTNLLYNWQQYNSGGSSSVVNGEVVPFGDYPVFRNFFPTPDGNVRTLPKMADIITNTASTAKRGGDIIYQELLPTYSRNLTFRLVARDYELTGGAFDYKELSFEVDGNSGPFVVGLPNNGTEVWMAGTNVDVGWNVAGTNVAPINCMEVDILLSVDGGWTYPYTLASNVSNNGNINVPLPAGIPQTNRARVKVECASYDNVRFFDISNNDFTINSSCTANGGILTPATNVSAPVGSGTLNLNLTPHFGDNADLLQFEIQASDPSGFFALQDGNGNCVSSNSQLKHELVEFQVDKTGDYTFTVDYDDENGGFFGVFANSYDPNNACSNYVGATGVENNGTSIKGAITINLSAGTTYYMAFHPWFTDMATGRVFFSSAVSGNIIVTNPTNPPTPAQDYSYTYAAINPANNQIVALNPNADFTGLTGGTYHIYGLSYKAANAPPDVVDPNTYLNQNMEVIQANGQCASFSENYVQLTAEACNLVMVIPLLTFGCNPNTNTYSQSLKIIYENQPGSGNLVINGQNFAITGSPQYETLTNLPVDGQPVNITAHFSASPSCQFTENSSFSPPAPDKVAGLALDCSPATDATEYLNLLGLSTTTNTLTLMAWIKRNGDQNNYTGLIFAETSGSGLNFGENNQLGYHWNNEQWWWASGLVVPDGEWTHVAMVANGTNVTLYLNGVAAVNNATPINLEFSTVRIGSYNGWSSRNFNGLIDDVRIINTALTQQQIREQMHIVANVCNDDLLAYYQFNETPGFLDKTGKTTIGVSGNVTRAVSEAPVAEGTAVTQTVNSTGVVDFNTSVDANLSINFTGAAPNGDVVVSQLTSEGPHGTAASNDPLSPSYWIVRNYGSTNAGLNANMTFQQSGWVISNTASDYTLYKRGSNSTGNWDAPINASSANAGSGEASFNGINNFSQFIIRRNPNISGCIITDISAGNQTPCNSGTNTYSQDVTVTYSSPPAMENLVVQGQSFAITSSPQTVTLANLTADGQAVNVTAMFSNTTCSLTENGVFTAPNACNGGQSNCNLYVATDTPKEISEIETPTITSTINVPVSGTISDLNIKNLMGTHTYIADLTFSLTSPQGTTVTLINSRCGNLDDFNINLDDEATNNLPCPYADGNTYLPDNALSVFNNENPFGNWILTIADGADQDGGQLSSWSLEICGTLGTATCGPAPPSSGTINAETYYNPSISTGGTVLSPSTVVFKSGNDVTLTNNFEVQLGATFMVLMENCGFFFGEEEVEDRWDAKQENQVSNNVLKIAPNPFSNQTVISYELKETSDVSIIVSNLNGQVLEHLFEAATQNSGNYQLVFNAEDYPKGVYLVSMKTMEGIVNERIVVAW